MVIIGKTKCRITVSRERIELRQRTMVDDSYTTIDC